MAVLQDIDEVLRAHQAIRQPGPGAPQIINGARVGSSLLRSATLLISAMLQVSVEETFKAALVEGFVHYSDEERERYWADAKQSSGNPNPQNINRLFFRIGFNQVLDGLSWRKRANTEVLAVLDRINQVRNRVAHGQPITVDGNPYVLTRPIVNGWRNFGDQFCNRFHDHVLARYRD